MKSRFWAVCLFLHTANAFGAGELTPGQIIDEVKCEANSAQSYALYLPSNFKPDRPWGVIFGFDPRARGRTPVERFQNAAEQYGYIVAGSNNSRNGSWDASMASIQAMSADVAARFPIDAKRVYTAGMSGGARVAMAVALGTDRIAGVVAASAGFPDSRPKKTVPFAIFGTAGTDDFNYMEMRQLDRAVTSPHHVAIFEGGHVWLSSELATQAIEWMEIQAVKSGRRERDDGLVGRLFAKRVELVNAQQSDKSRYLELESLVADFEGLRDVSQYAAKAAELRKSKAVKDALKKERGEETLEEQTMSEIFSLERGLENPEQRSMNFAQLKTRLTELSKKANAAEDSANRRVARRVIRGTLMSAMERSKDQEYRALVADLRKTNRPVGGDPAPANR